MRPLIAPTLAARTRRLLVLSGSGAANEGDGPLLRYIGKPIGNLFLKHQIADFRAMEAVVRALFTRPAR